MRRYYSETSEVLMELRLVCVIMPWSRGWLLSSLSKPSVAGSFKSSYAACGIRILQSPASPQWSRSGSASSKPPVPRPCPPDLRPCRRLPASTPPCARMICEPELSCAGMCKGNPNKHMVMLARFLVGRGEGGGGTFDSLNVASHCPRWMQIT